MPLHTSISGRGTRRRTRRTTSLLFQGLEAGKNSAEQRVHVLQWEMAQLGEGGGGADGKDGSETHQKELLRTLTDLAQASTEVCPRSSSRF